MANKRTTLNVLITGGTDGIGLLLARKYLSSGANVVITGKRDFVEVAAGLPHGLLYVQADQSNAGAAADTIVDALRQSGWSHCDIAILNAGSGTAGPPFAETADKLCQTLEVNLLAGVLIARALALLLFEAKNTRLVFIGSTAHKGAESFASYTASKAGLNGLARSLREEWRGRVVVKVINPGPVATAMHQKAGHEPGWIKRLFLDPDYVARAIKCQIEKAGSPVTIGFVARIIDVVTLKRHWTS